MKYRLKSSQYYHKIFHNYDIFFKLNVLGNLTVWPLMLVSQLFSRQAVPSCSQMADINTKIQQLRNQYDNYQKSEIMRNEHLFLLKFDRFFHGPAPIIFVSVPWMPYSYCLGYGKAFLGQREVEDIRWCDGPNPRPNAGAWAGVETEIKTNGVS